MLIILCSRRNTDGAEPDEKVFSQLIREYHFETDITGHDSQQDICDKEYA
jgi:hypothetical protein